MRSIIVTVSLMALTAAGANAALPASGAAAEPQCVKDLTHLARPGKRAELKKLNELPPAEAYVPMLRSRPDGCIVPVKFNERYGPPERSPGPPKRR